MKAGCSFRMSLLCRFSTSIVGVTSDKKIFIKVRILSLNESFGHVCVPSCVMETSLSISPAFFGNSKKFDSCLLPSYWQNIQAV